MQPKLIEIDCDGMTEITFISYQDLYVFGTSKGELVLIKKGGMFPSNISIKDAVRTSSLQAYQINYEVPDSFRCAVETIEPCLLEIPDNDTGVTSYLRVGFGEKSKCWVQFGDVEKKNRCVGVG